MQMAIAGSCELDANESILVLKNRDIDQLLPWAKRGAKELWSTV
jgi:hypothetical protein